MTETFFIEASIPVETLEEGVRRQDGKAVVTLQAVVRRDGEGASALDHVVYEAERTRAHDEAAALCREVAERWRGAVLLFRHRLGAVRVGETSVFIAVTADRREDAMAACHSVMDRVRNLPGLRKRDVFKDGTSRLSHVLRETLLLSDDALSLPQS